MRRLTILLTVLALAGCGGDDPVLSGDPIPLADYIARADKICKDGREDARREIAQLQTRLGRDGDLSTDDVMLLNDSGADQVRPLVGKLTELPPPDSKREEADDYTRAMQDTLKALDESVAAYRSGDEDAAAEALARNRELAGGIVANARKVGFKECGTEFSE